MAGSIEITRHLWEIVQDCDTGIGYYSALLIVSEAGDIDRFPDSYHLCSYAGLIPSTCSIRWMTYHGSITKTGSK